MITLCVACIFKGFTIRQLYSAMVMRPFATNCRGAGLHS